jgi:hypothetical protein
MVLFKYKVLGGYFLKRTLFSFMLIFVLVSLVGCGEDEGASANENNSSEGTKGQLKPEDYEKMFSDPGQYKGYEVELTGQVFTEPEKDEDGTYLQLWADPENVEKNVIVGIEDPELEVNTDDYVKVSGVLKEEFEGENAFGATVVAPSILADKVEVVDYITAVSPTIKEIKVDKTKEQHGLSVTVQKVDIAKNQTRVYIKLNNGTNNNASFYSHSTKLLIGNQQLEEEYMDPDTMGLKELASDILPGVETEGVITYPAIEDDPDNIKLYIESNTDDYNLDFKPYEFEIPVK